MSDQSEAIREERLSLEISVAREVGTMRSPWVNKKFLGVCKSMGVSMEGFKGYILRILVEIENRKCFESVKS